MNRALGRRPPSRKPALRLALTGRAPEHPGLVDHLNRAGLEFGLYENDRFGDCGPTSVANLVRMTSSWLTGQVEEPTQDEVFELYRASGNPEFNPETGADDNGVDMQTMLEALLEHGIGGRRPLAFAKVNPDLDSLRAAVAIFGGVLLGVNLMRAQDGQTDAGLWDYVSSDEWGGHAILAGQYADQQAASDDRLGVITWALQVETTDAFLEHQLDEAWVVIFPEHLTDQGFLAGVDLVMMAADYQTLTGKPFPSAVVPTPGPFPQTIGGLLHDLATDPSVVRFLSHSHVGYLSKVAEAVRRVVERAP